jgi:hypothetical protein
MFKRMEKLGREIPLPQAERMCLTKQRFHSKNEARDYGLYAAKKHNCGPITPYRCELCGLYHLTSIPKTDKPLLREAKKRAKERARGT